MASIPGKIFRTLIIDRNAKKMTMEELIKQLRDNHPKLMSQIGAAADSEKNRRQLSHAIGIERWGQSRLRVALGAPLTMDEYNGYRPKREVPMDELVQQFDETRQETVTIGEELSSHANIAAKTVEHNMMGNMTVGSWLYYLDMHSTFELKNVS